MGDMRFGAQPRHCQSQSMRIPACAEDFSMVRLSTWIALMVSAALFVVSIATASAQPSFKLTDLGSLAVTLPSQSSGINSSGVVVGSLTASTSGQLYGAVWSSTGLLSELLYGNSTNALALNDSDFFVGQIAFTGSADTEAYISSPYEGSQALSGGYATANAINGFGTVVGTGIAKTTSDFLEWSGPYYPLTADIAPQGGYNSAVATAVSDLDWKLVI